MNSTIIIFADELVSILDQDLDATEELDQLRQAIWAYRTHANPKPAPRPTKQASTRIQNSARWMYLAGQHDLDLLAEDVRVLWGVDEPEARRHAATAARHAAPEGTTPSHPIPYTQGQQYTLKKYPNLRVAQSLEDGDLLVLDTQRSLISVTGNSGPYIITRDGALQDVNYHYQTRHAMPDVPFGY